jgi:hypothetical protein
MTVTTEPNRRVELLTLNGERVAGSWYASGTFAVAMPAFYDPARVTMEDVVLDESIDLVEHSQLVTALLDDDGARWESRDGVDFDELCKRFGASCERDADRERWVFADGSALVATANAWDHGFADRDGCFCWQGAVRDYPEHDGHAPACPHADGSNQ